MMSLGAQAEGANAFENTWGRPIRRVLLGTQHHSDRRNFLFAWSIVGVMALIDALWLPQSKLVFAPGWKILFPVLLFAPLGACWLAFWFVRYRLGADQSPTAIGMRIVCERGSLLIHVLTLKFSLIVALYIFLYLAAAVGWPAQDGLLAAIDQWMGFDWHAFLKWTNASPVVANALMAAYGSSGSQLLALYILLSLLGHRRQLAEGLAVLALTALLTGVINLVVPAAGAYAFYDPDRAMFSNFSANAGMWHYELWVHLRTHPKPVLDFETIEGMVTFPSFHTVLAIITPYAVRHIRILFVPVAVLNAVVLVATLPQGGHYLIDLLAGALVAVVCIVLVRLLAGRPPRCPAALGVPAK